MGRAESYFRSSRRCKETRDAGYYFFAPRETAQEVFTFVCGIVLCAAFFGTLGFVFGYNAGQSDQAVKSYAEICFPR